MLEPQANKESTVIVIPTHKTELSALDMQSLKQVYTILKDYPIYIIHPEGIELNYLNKDFPNLQFMAFHPSFFESFASFNSLMMDIDLYQRFSELGHIYMLVYHLDAYIFEDKLDYFISKEYDYVGAPTLKRKLYKYLPCLEKLKYAKKKYNTDAITWQQNGNLEPGNGGLSLRKIQSHYDACIKYADRIEVYRKQKCISSVYYEDTFWTREPHEFKYPTLEDALLFSFEKYPQLCLKKNNNQLPMGCHAWYKWKWRSFWEKHIAFAE